jgi:hypothetical protein
MQHWEFVALVIFFGVALAWVYCEALKVETRGLRALLKRLLKKEK